MTPDDFYKLRQLQLSSNGKENILSKNLICNVIKTSIQRGQGNIVSVMDDKDNIHSAIFIVWDNNCAYQIITAINPKYKYTDATTFAIWETIKKLNTITKSFDFCGSMVEEVECFKRQFGATQVPYFKITKYIKPITILKEICNI